MLKLILLSWFPGIMIFVGGLLAHLFNHHVRESPIKYEIIHTLMSFGAGVILSAIVFVLMPAGMESLSLFPIILTFLSGATIFMLTDKWLAKRGGQQATLLAMMLDFIPESIAIGAVFITDSSKATLLAVFIGLQNLPEAFNAYRDLVQSGFSTTKTLFIFFCLSFLGVISAYIGFTMLSDSPVLTAYLMVFASGGILYLLIQDIIPESKLEKNYLTSMGATIGFLVGVIGEKVV